MDAIFGILLMVVLVFVFGLFYKKRSAISRWLEDPDLVAGFDLKIQRMNMEHKRDILNRRLEIIDKMDTK